MLDPQIVVNLLLEFGVCVDLMRHGIDLVKGSSVALNGSHQGLGGIVDERSCRECAPRPSEGLPKGGTQVLAVYVTPGQRQLDDCVALALQQHGQQSALCKGRG